MFLSCYGSLGPEKVLENGVSLLSTPSREHTSFPIYLGTSQADHQSGCGAWRILPGVVQWSDLLFGQGGLYRTPALLGLEGNGGKENQ